MTTRTLGSTTLAAIGAVALCVATTPASAQFGGFGPPTILSAGATDKPAAVVMGDFDGDGDIDLAVTYSGSDRVAIFKNIGNGTSFEPLFTVENVGLIPYSIVTGDLDQDNDLDLATSNLVSNNVSVLKNDGLGGFPNINTFPVVEQPQSVAIADLNGDGALDLVAGNITQWAGGDSFSILLNDGNASFSTLAPLDVTNEPFAMAVADLNGDTYNDVVAATLLARVSVRLWTGNNNGVPQFGPEALFPAGAIGAGSSVDVAPADVDGDGDVDLLVANTGGTGISSSVGILKNNDNGTFPPPQLITLTFLPVSLAVEDVDGDLHPDFVIAGNDNQIRAFLNDGGGLFSQSSGSVPVGGLTVADIALGDLDGNGSPDAAVAFKGNAFNNGGVAVLLNQTVVNAPRGFNLTAPGTGACLAPPLTPTLVWTDALGFAIDYTVRIATDPLFTQNVLEWTGLTETHFKVPAGTLAAGTLYYWTVIASNPTGQTQSTPASLTFSTQSLAELSGDCVVDVVDLTILLDAFGPCPAPPNPCPADLIVNGVVDGADLAFLLANWTDPNNPPPPLPGMMAPGAGDPSSTNLAPDDAAPNNQSQAPDVPWILAELGFTSVAEYVEWVDALTEAELFEHIQVLLQMIQQ